jgi:hypothetical protein
VLRGHSRAQAFTPQPGKPKATLRRVARCGWTGPDKRGLSGPCPRFEPAHRTPASLPARAPLPSLRRLSTADSTRAATNGLHGHQRQRRCPRALGTRPRAVVGVLGPVTGAVHSAGRQPEPTAELDHPPDQAPTERSGDISDIPREDGLYGSEGESRSTFDCWWTVTVACGHRPGRS